MEKQHITGNIGKAFEITLPDNSGSTGYEWMAAQIPPCVLLDAIDVRPPVPPMPGKPGARIFRFIGASQGSGVIRLVLARVWELPKLAETIEYEVAVSLAPASAEV